MSDIKESVVELIGKSKMQKRKAYLSQAQQLSSLHQVIQVSVLQQLLQQKDTELFLHYLIP